MNSQLSAQHLEQITAGIQEKYDKVSVSLEGQFTYPTGREGLNRLGYDDDLIAGLPDAVADSFCGVGNPFSLGKIGQGSRVLDIGCGAGVDTLLAAGLVGASGEVLGIDLTRQMIACANANKKTMNADNVTFQVSRVQALAEKDGHFDFIISNGVFNLIPEKEQALEAALQLLKPGGKLFIADQFLIGPLTKDINARVATWFQ